MFKISKKISLALFSTFQLVSLFYMVQVINYFSSIEEVFRNFKYLFSSILIALLFLTSYCYSDYSTNKKIINKKLALLTLIFLILITVFFSLFIFKLMNYNFLSGKILYWQISSLIIGILSIGTLVYIHQKMIMKK
jgi:uncharacterized membrane protein YczE